MEIGRFITLIQNELPEGFEFDNPGNGTSKVIGHTSEKVSYRRRKSIIYLSYTDMFNTYSTFSGEVVSSSDLKSYLPSVFDSNARPAGHSCNCTFLFMVLNRIGLASSIGGGGVRGNPFNARFK